MTNIWLLKKLSTLWQTTPAGWVHYFSLPCLPEGSSVSSFLFMLGNSLEAPCFKNNPLAATPGDGWIAGANGCKGLMSVEVAFCLESSAAGCFAFFFCTLEKKSCMMCEGAKCLRKGHWNELPPAIWPGRGKGLWHPGCVWHQAFPGRLARHGFMIAIPKQWCSQLTLVLLRVLASQTYKKLCKINDQCCLIPSWANSLHFNNFGQTSQQAKGKSAKCNNIYPDNVNSLFPHLPVANISSK